MAKYATFEELKKDRKELVEVVRKNGMLDGLTRLLTELYPDEAHFIYELLQNAEDKEATQVSFKLFNDKLVFAHNGTKRDFILDDIDAITNIGQSTKKDDPTSIGKFGVGFKAVYSYTNTPEIHSGKYDFKIVNMLIPEDDGVSKIAKTGVTRFVFPFDNPSKPPLKALTEIKAGLLSLNENSIIFLKNIKQITFTLPDGKVGGVKVIDDANSSVNKTIIHLDALSNIKNRTYWTKFTKECSIGNCNYPVSIAYRMKKEGENENISYKVDSELKGNVCIYFPAVKENSNLHFHINAPFASTVARDSVRSCPENKALIKELAILTVQSLYYFKSINLLDLNVYAALPNKRDFEHNYDSSYYVIYSSVINEFRTQELIVTDTGAYKKIPEVMQSNREIVKLINSNDVYRLFKKFWIPAVNPQTRELYFLQDLNIQQYDRRTIAEALRVNPRFFDTLFSEKPSEWFRDWYVLLADITGVGLYKEIFKRVSMIRCKDGLLHKPTDDIYLYNYRYQPANIKNPIYVDISDANTSLNDKAKNFLEMLGIKFMSEDVDIMADIANKSTVNKDDVVLAIMQILEKFKAKEDVSSFKDKAIFIATEYTTGTTSIVKACDCSVSKEVAFFYQNSNSTKYVLSLESYSIFSTLPEKELFLKLFECLGGKTKPEIKSSVITHLHPQYNQLNTSNERYDSCTKEDYTLTGYEVLSKIKTQNLYKESLLLWNIVVADKNYLHHEAHYAANGRRKIETIESTAAYYLRRIEWIPNKDGVFCRPCDVSKDDLYEGFIYSSNAILLNNLGFGDKSKTPNDMATALKKAGFKITTMDEQWLRMSDEEKQEFIDLFAKTRKAREKLTFGQALENENKDQIPFDDDDYYGVDIGIKNVQKRQTKQRQEFEEGLEITPKKHQVWKYTYASKKTGPEKQFVQEQYHGKCQICGRDAIRKANGQPYFEAINIIDTSSLDDKYQNNLDTGWNTLCLCPNCAAEYRYCQKNLSDLQEQIAETHLEDRKSQMVELFIVLKNLRTKISFTPKHFLALQTAFEVFKQYEKKD